MESRGIPLPELRQVPKIVTPDPGQSLGAWFDGTRVDQVLSVFAMMKHSQGKWAGKQLRPDPWQIMWLLAPVFGWIHLDDDGDPVRIIKKLYCDIPRKNGKTTLAGGIAVYLLAGDREQGAQVYAAAYKKDQASKLFQPIKELVEKSPALLKHLRPLQGKILHKASGSYFQVEANDPDGLHGANVHGAIVDELHIHKSPELLKALETGIGSRQQPLIVIITTADDGKVESVYAQRRKLIEEIAKGIVTDEQYYGVVWAADEKDDPFTEATWLKANPGYPISPMKSFMRGAATEAQNSPAELAAFLRLHLGIRANQDTRYISVTEWDDSAGTPVEEEELEGQNAYGGLDLADVDDLTALCWLFPQPDGTIIPLWRLWTPKDNLPRLDKLTSNMASVWVREGFLMTTPGNVMDQNIVEAQILADADKFQVQDLAYDRYNATRLITDLDAAGIPVTPVGQGFVSMNRLIRAMHRSVKQGRFRHGGQPAMRWQLDKFRIKMDTAGNIAPDRQLVRAEGGKMDGIVAALMGFEGVITAPDSINFEDFYDGD